MPGPSSSAGRRLWVRARRAQRRARPGAGPLGRPTVAEIRKRRQRCRPPHRGTGHREHPNRRNPRPPQPPYPNPAVRRKAWKPASCRAMPCPDAAPRQPRRKPPPRGRALPKRSRNSAARPSSASATQSWATGVASFHFSGSDSAFGCSGCSATSSRRRRASITSGSKNASAAAAAASAASSASSRATVMSSPRAIR